MPAPLTRLLARASVVQTLPQPRNADQCNMLGESGGRSELFVEICAALLEGSCRVRVSRGGFDSVVGGIAVGGERLVVCGRMRERDEAWVTFL